MTTTRHLALALAAALAASAATAGPSAALGGETTRSRAVEFGDLDLSRPADGDILHRRIVRAAHDVCAEGWILTSGADRRRCFREAVQNAVDRLDRPALTEAHLERFRWATSPGHGARLAER